MAVAIRVRELGKQYRIGSRHEAYRTMRDILADALTAPFRRAWRTLRGDASAASSLTEAFWALREVSFDIHQGEVIGIIGRNGAGKSTLLKILSRITTPTTGRAWINGRVGALLEVGTGFHPELTGRENIYLNGAILGMAREEIARKFEAIVSFAEVEQFIDTPVKHYSSGMGLRLGFAVAAHLEPEILIVDEVLAVGDAQFQKKCLGKMSDVASEGRTVLLVSHNMIAVQSMCSRVIWLDAGRVVGEGAADRVVADYLKTALAACTERVWEDIDTAPGDEHVRIHRVAARPEGGSTADPITVSTPVLLEFEYWNLQPDTHLSLSLHVYTDQGILAFDTGQLYEPVWYGRPFPKGLFKSVCHIPGDLLNDGTYRVELIVVKDQAHVIYKMDEALVLEITESEARLRASSWHGKWPGVLRPNLKWTTELAAAELAVPDRA